MSQDKIQKARELVLNYIATHTLSDKLNRAVNEVCRSRPKDPWLFLSDIISEWTKDVPIIDRLVAKQGIDSYGNSSIQLQLFGRVSNARPPRYLGVENVFITSRDEAKNNANEEKKQDSDTNTVQSVMKKVSEIVSPGLRSIRIDEQRKIDNELCNLYASNDANKFNITGTISNLIALTTSNYLRMPLYKYLNSKININMNLNDDNINYTLPNIMAELIKFPSNKLPSVSIVTTDNKRPIDRIHMITDISNQIINIINTDLNRKNVCFDRNNGAVLLEDTDCKDMESLLSLIHKAIGNYKILRDVSLCLSFSSNPHILRYDKEGNYILNGDIKTKDDVIEYFNGLMERYNIKYLEDPLYDGDGETYALLNDKQIQFQTEKTNGEVVIVGNKLYANKVDVIKKGISYGWSNGVCLAICEMFTLTKALDISNMVRECNGSKGRDRTVLMMDGGGSCNGNAQNVYCIDLAVACNADVIRLSLPNGGIGGNGYNRWLMVADELCVEVDYNEDIEEVNHVTTMASIDEQGDNENESGNLKGNVGNDVDKTEDLP